MFAVNYKTGKITKLPNYEMLRVSFLGGESRIHMQPQRQPPRPERRLPGCYSTEFAIVEAEPPWPADSTSRANFGFAPKR